MEKQLVEFIDSIKSNQQIGSFDEASTKQAIVLRLLFLLGWDIFNIDEVNPNLASETQQADYALSIKNTLKVFIKVVKPKGSLDKYQEKVFAYAFKKGVEFTILTNGANWWFYLSLNQGQALQNRFAVLDFIKQKSNEIAEEVTVFLKRDEISKGAALKKATEIINSRLQQAARKAIPDAWSKLLSEPHDGLIRLVADTAEKISGVLPEKEAIIKFLNERLKQSQPTETPPLRFEEKAAIRAESVAPPLRFEEKAAIRTESVAPPPRFEEKAVFKRQKIASPPEKGAPKTYDGQSVASFTLKGKHYKVKSWEELLVKFCEVLKTEFDQDIDSLQWHSVGKKYYFNKNEYELHVPAGIPGTDMFVETYLNPNEIVNLVRSVLTGCGFADSDLVIS